MDTPTDSSRLRDLARSLHALESIDKSPFQRRARVLQTMWREEQGYGLGTVNGRTGPRPSGSRLPMPWARETLANFLTPRIRDVVRAEVLDPVKSEGKLYGKPRIFDNLLSSQPMCFNLFAGLALDHDLATRVFCRLSDNLVRQITRTEFEHSPGRRDPKYTGDRSAFDFYVEYAGCNGSIGFIGIEVKYHENLEGQPADLKPRHFEIAERMGCFKPEAMEEVCRLPLEQIWRDHLLAGAILNVGDFKRGMFAILYPAGNEACAVAVARYRQCLSDSRTFAAWTLEDVWQAIRLETDAEWVRLFYERYLAFDKVAARIR